jgi:AraC-like DNA-binding protein
MAGSILVVRGLVEALEHSGVTRAALFQRTGFDGGRLQELDGRVEADELGALQEAALDLTANGAFGLTLGLGTTASTFNFSNRLLAHATTLRDGIAELVEFDRLLADRPSWRLDEQGETATLIYDAGPGSPRCRRLRAEAALSGVYRTVKHLGGSRKPAVLFDYPAPDYRAEYARAFEGTERFEQALTGIAFDRQLLDTPRRPDRTAYDVSSSLETRLARADRKTTYSERVREYVLISAPPDRHNMEAVARGLGLSGRSLRRRLREEGKSYGAIVESALATVAKRLISDEQRSIEATAYAMGYSDATAFHRAFKRWTGSTPGAYRSSRPPPPDLSREDREPRQVDLSS